MTFTIFNIDEDFLRALEEVQAKSKAAKEKKAKQAQKLEELRKIHKRVVDKSNQDSGVTGNFADILSSISVPTTTATSPPAEIEGENTAVSEEVLENSVIAVAKKEGSNTPYMPDEETTKRSVEPQGFDLDRNLGMIAQAAFWHGMRQFNNNTYTSPSAFSNPLAIDTRSDDEKSLDMGAFLTDAPLTTWGEYLTNTLIKPAETGCKIEILTPCESLLVEAGVEQLVLKENTIYILPVNTKDTHWSCAVTYLEKNEETGKLVVAFRHYDSLHPMNKDAAMRTYRAVCAATISAAGSEIGEVGYETDFRIAKCERQSSSAGCGPWAAFYMETLVRNFLNLEMPAPFDEAKMRNRLKEVYLASKKKE